ncbi:PREDICTED: uncharacterized protein LOC106148628 [Chinchilla lanigera]|uniref:uncharacterized protein LOC106148628 n=1 Tax=Chinchilla lanigera TaxID=34839 RepID=UPI00069664C2|nr:PREDICTED: uncharacterized protein LOC106148628 [Chinchilla lanigera]
MPLGSLPTTTTTNTPTCLNDFYALQDVNKTLPPPSRLPWQVERLGMTLSSNLRSVDASDSLCLSVLNNPLFLYLETSINCELFKEELHLLHLRIPTSLMRACPVHGWHSVTNLLGTGAKSLKFPSQQQWIRNNHTSSTAWIILNGRNGGGIAGSIPEITHSTVCLFCQELTVTLNNGSNSCDNSPQFDEVWLNSENTAGYF